MKGSQKHNGLNGDILEIEWNHAQLGSGKLYPKKPKIKRIPRKLKKWLKNNPMNLFSVSVKRVIYPAAEVTFDGPIVRVNCVGGWI